MRKLLPALLLLAVASALGAQTFDLEGSHEAIISLDGNWRFHPGDDPHWSDPAFDDSSWPLLHSDQSWYEQGYPGLAGYAWYRFTLRIPAGSPPVSILLPPITTSYTLYVDGERIGDYGRKGSELFFAPPRFQSFPLTVTASSTTQLLHVAIRVYHSTEWSNYAPGGPDGAGSAGAASVINTIVHAKQRDFETRNIDLYVDTLLRAIIGLLILWLFLLRPREREYLWFAAVQLFGGADDILNFFHGAYASIPIQLFDLSDASLAAGFWIAGIFFFASVLKQPRNFWFRSAVFLAMLSPLGIPLYWFGWVPVPVSDVLTTVLVLPSLIWVLTLLIVRSLRGDTDARLLLVPTLLVHGMYLVSNVFLDLGQLNIIQQQADLTAYRLHLIPFDFSLYTIFNILFLVAMMVFLLRRFSLARQQEERLLGELEAARVVQQVLIPDEIPHVPGFHIESVYKPASQVGGDFFQIVATPNQGALIAIGDVSGKGMPAAMTVSLLVGTFRTLAHYTHLPGEILAAMNQRMLARSAGGFTTCLVMYIDADGKLAAANAGHLAPYLDGKELALENGLPLGLAADATYRESHFSLSSTSQLTLITDGVLEARNAAGELYGFERTAAVSSKTADQIARTAELFGQEDDITVLTLRFAAAEVAHA